MAITSNTVANQAIAMIGGNLPLVTGQAPTFDNSAAGVALQALYPSCVRTVMGEFGWEFARSNVLLSPTGNDPPIPWQYEYAFPASALDVWQVSPHIIADLNNPLPVLWMIGNAVVGGTQSRVIWTNVLSAIAVINNAPAESTWDANFQEAVVRLLASELGMALFGRPDTTQQMLESGAAFETIAERKAN